ncbi:ATP-binding protein [Ramlibacter sp.]|uniref:sensor histidine kinase n=1 Tax=Ramlibacter sp. TaxID=1917967 RepID=UPI003D136E67
MPLQQDIQGAQGRAPDERQALAYAAAFEAAGVGMAVLAPDGRVLQANAALCAMLGYTRAELCRFGLQAIVHSEDVESDRASRSALSQAGGGDRADGGDVEVVDRRHLRFRDRRGRTVDTQLTRAVVRGDDGEPLYFVDQVEDLTESQRSDKEIVLLNNLLEQRIRRRTAELEKSNEDLREFAYSIAHDLRGPLASIDGFSSRLQETLGAALGERHAHYLRRIRAGVRTMSELTDGLLALADISRSDLVRVPVDLSAIAADVVERLRELDPQRRVAIVIDGTPPAMGDPRLLTNVMDNLLSNAWKFSGRRDDGRIVFGALVTDGRAEYFVSDNGAGFDPAHVDKLFVPFQRLHTAAEFEGTGIGLALVRKILSRHGGGISAQSKPGEGATFRFTVGDS